MGLGGFIPPYMAPETAGDAVMRGVNYASGGGGILNQTGSIFVSTRPPPFLLCEVVVLQYCAIFTFAYVFVFILRARCGGGQWPSPLHESLLQLLLFCVNTQLTNR